MTARPVTVVARRGARCGNVAAVGASGRCGSAVVGGVATAALGRKAAGAGAAWSSRGVRVVVRAADEEDVPPWERREIEKKAAMDKAGFG